MKQLKRWIPIAVFFFAQSGCGGGPSMTSQAVYYTFTSGPVAEGGDGFDWPASPTGLIDDFPSTWFTTPHGVSFFHDIGNNLFFDSNYIIPDDPAAGNGIVDEALWGNPRPINMTMVEVVYIRFESPVTSVAFDFSWVLGGEQVVVAVGDEPGGEFATFELTGTFPAGPPFQNGIGNFERIEFSVDSLLAQHGIEVSEIGFVDIFVDEVSTGGATAAFAIDNLATNGATAP